MTRKILLGPDGVVENVLVDGDSYETPDEHELRDSVTGVSPGDAWDGTEYVERPSPAHEWDGKQFVEVER